STRARVTKPGRRTATARPPSWAAPTSPMSARRFVLPAVLVAVLATAVPAVAQTPIEDPLDRRDAKRLDHMGKVLREIRSIVLKGRDSGAPVVVEPSDTPARLEEMNTKISDLEASLKSVNGSLETATRDLNQAKRDNAALKTQVQTLTERLSAAEQKLTEASTAAAPAPAQTAAAAPPAAAAGDPGAAFTKARQLMLAGDYDAAESAFASYVSTYPDAPKTPEASYWWGKTLSVRGDHADAAKA